MIFIVSRQVFTLNLSAFFFRGRFDGWLLFLRSYALKITKHPLPKPEQQVLTSPWCHHTLKLVFKPEKDEQIYLDALNSKSYFYETGKFFHWILKLLMSVEELPTSVWRHFSHNIVCFLVSSFTGKYVFISSLLLYSEQKTKKFIASTLWHI